MKHHPDQDVADNHRSVRRRARQLEQRQRRALREQGQQLLERAGRLLAPRNDEGPPCRTGRSFPRVVKKRASKFPTKKMPVSS